MAAAIGGGAEERVRAREVGALVGAMAGTLAFLAAGVLPGLVYGGYMGVLLGASASGAPLVAGPVTSAVILAGMAVGVLCCWSMFTVTGASIGAMAGWLAESLSGVDEHVPAR